MKKTAYQKELVIKNTHKKNGASNNKKDVLKIQSWLSLYAIQHPNSGTSTNIDGDFGPATEGAVKNFQTALGIPTSGVVDQKMFSLLSINMKNAFEKPLINNHIRKLVVEVAENHLKNHPYELTIKGASNSGPWVRSYMDGNDGSPWFWCMGFVQAVLDQAASARGKNFKTLMPLTYSCDTVGMTGIQKGLLHRFQEIRKNHTLIQPGDIFLSQKSKYDWTHTGIVTAVGEGFIEAIEGNTNTEGSRNGVAVMKRTRNFRKSKIDIFSIEPLV